MHNNLSINDRKKESLRLDNNKTYFSIALLTFIDYEVYTL